MRKVLLRMNEEEKYEVIKELVEHKGNKNRASKKLNISRRQIDRLIINYKEKGKSGFIHGNRSKKPANTLDKTISEDIVLLYSTKYQGFNFNHYKDMLKEYENISVSYDFIYKHLTKEGFLSPKANKQTKRTFIKEQLMKESKLKNKSEEEINKIVNHEIELEYSHPRGEKPKYFGEVIEQDGSIHNWFGNKKSCLHLAADKATNTIVGGYFDKQETLNGYYNVFYQILTNYGIPFSFITDNRTVFNYMSLNPDKRTSDKDVLTQYGYACSQLGVDLKTTSVSQAKGLIERDNGTFQGRLVNELKLNNITTIEGANNYLINVFIPRFNKRFSIDYNKFESAFEQAPSVHRINCILSVLTTRKIDNGNSIKYHNQYYQPYLNDQLKCFLPRTECLVIKTFDNNLLITIDEHVYTLNPISRNERFSKNFDETIIIRTQEKYIPPMTHPWKLESFKKQLTKAHYQHRYA